MSDKDEMINIYRDGKLIAVLPESFLEHPEVKRRHRELFDKTVAVPDRIIPEGVKSKEYVPEYDYLKLKKQSSQFTDWPELEVVYSFNTVLERMMSKAVCDSVQSSVDFTKGFLKNEY